MIVEQITLTLPQNLLLTGCNVAILDRGQNRAVYKVYRGLRSPLQNITYLGARYLFEIENFSTFSIITYPFQVGTHNPTCGRQFVRILRQLEYLHRKKLVFADIHILNMVFAPAEVVQVSLFSSDALPAGLLKNVYPSTFIDFDFVGKVGTPYDDRFNWDLDSKIGQRSSVNQTMVYQYQDDYHSMAYVMRLFEPDRVDGSSGNETDDWWSLAIKEVKIGNFSQAISIISLAANRDLKLHRRVAVSTTESHSGSGSPIKVASVAEAGPARMSAIDENSADEDIVEAAAAASSAMATSADMIAIHQSLGSFDDITNDVAPVTMVSAAASSGAASAVSVAAASQAARPRTRALRKAAQ